MCFRALRRRLVGRGLAVVLAAIVAGTAFDWGHPGDDDEACSLVVRQHDVTAHRVTSDRNRSPRGPEHCFICHTLRTLHAALTARLAGASLDVRSTAAPTTSACAARAIGHTALASRAPPAALL